MKSLTSIIRADYMQRARSYPFLITLLASICFAYTFVPPADANYTTVRVGNYVGFQNAAWVGHVTAIMASTFLWLIGFYLINNGIRRDMETGVGQIIATTSITNFKYLLAKSLSNFLVLLTIVILVMCMGIALVFMRGSEQPFNFTQFFLPYLLATVPSLFFVSIVAVFAEVVFGKYTNLQNVAYFVLFTIIVGNVNASSKEGMYWFDVLGTKQLTDNISHIVNTTYTDTTRKVSVGFIVGGVQTKKQFLFEGSDWSALYLFRRLTWIGLGFVLLLVSSKLFHRFDTKEGLSFRKKKQALAEEKITVPPEDIQLRNLPRAEPAFGILPLLKTEFLMLVRKGPRWFWLVNLAGFVALFFIPLTPAHQIALPALWFLQINRWADVVTKEKYFGTHYFTYASYRPLERLLTSQILSAFLLAIMLGIPLIFRHLAGGNTSAAVSVIIGALLLVTFAVFTGIVTGGKRFFEVVFFLLTYMNISVFPYTDYFGGLHSGLNYNLMLLALTVALSLIAYGIRFREIQKN